MILPNSWQNNGIKFNTKLYITLIKTQRRYTAKGKCKNIKQLVQVIIFQIYNFLKYNDSNSVPGEEWIIGVILELMDCKRGVRTCGLNYHDICDLYV